MAGAEALMLGLVVVEWTMGLLVTGGATTGLEVGVLPDKACSWVDVDLTGGTTVAGSAFEVDELEEVAEVVEEVVDEVLDEVVGVAEEVVVVWDWV